MPYFSIENKSPDLTKVAPKEPEKKPKQELNEEQKVPVKDPWEGLKVLLVPPHPGDEPLIK